MRFGEKAHINLVEDSVDLHTDNLLSNNETTVIQLGNILLNNIKTSSHFLLFYFTNSLKKA